MLGETDPGRDTRGWAWLRAARNRLGLDIARDWADRQPRKVGLTFALLVSAVIMATTGGLAYVTASSAGDAGRARALAERVERAAKQARAAFGPIRLTSLTPSAGSVDVTGATTVQINLSAPVAVNSAMPQISPATPGRWLISGNMLTFTPHTSFAPATSFTIRIPAGVDGLRSVAGGTLARSAVVRFRTERYSTVRLAQLLSLLGYLPLSWLRERGQVMAGMTGAGLPAQQAMAFSPPAGVFTWHPGYPATLRSQWRIDASSPVIRGAVMAFQAQHGITINGAVSPRLWSALFAAVDSGQRNTVGYSYAVASKGSPERLTIWHDGQVVLRSLTNTGVAVAPTASGTFPVYLRYRNTIMSGTNPDGSHYADPVSFVSYFNGGDAVHYFARGSYGWPQSLGCVELPYQAAARAWPLLTYGSLVTVTG